MSKKIQKALTFKYRQTVHTAYAQKLRFLKTLIFTILALTVAVGSGGENSNFHFPQDNRQTMTYPFK